jgi:putative addiction module killer protein
MSKYEVRKTEEFDDWIGALRDTVAKKRILKRVMKTATGHFGDTEPVGDKVSELKFMFGPGYRAYYTIKNGEVVFVLGGGTKKTQQADIDAAKELAADLP